MKTITYRAANTKDGNWYVGSTEQTLEARKKQHLENPNNDRFHNALRKDPDSFLWEVLSVTENRDHEQEILDVWHGSEYCYNVSRFAVGGFGWKHISEETLKEIGKNVGLYYNNEFAKNNPELYASYQSSKGRAGAEVVHTRLNNEGKSEHATNMGRRSVEKRRQNPNYSKEQKRAADRVRKNHRSVEVLAVYQKTGDRVNIDSLTTAHFLIAREMTYSKFTYAIKTGKMVNGYFLYRVQ